MDELEATSDASSDARDSAMNPAEVAVDSSDDDATPHTQRLPPTLLLLYAVAAFEFTFPDTANAQRLNGSGVPQATQLAMYATGFAMSSLKPLYGAAVDAAGARLGRAAGARLVYGLAAGGSVACHLWFAGATTPRALVASYVALSGFQACGEMVLSARLADAVAAGAAAPRAQAAATAARWAGSLAAAVATLRMYRCGRGAPPRAAPVLRLAAAPAAAGAAVVAVEHVLARGGDAAVPRTGPLRPGRVVLAALAQALVVWVGARTSAVPRAVWRAVLGALAAAAAAAAAFALAPRKTAPDALASPLLGARPRAAVDAAVLAPAVFLFALEAAPCVQINQ